jgi:hypothetical protein
MHISVLDHCGSLLRGNLNKKILLLSEPLALVTVNLPSLTVTVFVPSTQRDASVGVPSTVSTPSTLILYRLDV